jgi:toxin YoeB
VVDNNGPRLALCHALDRVAADERWPAIAPQRVAVPDLGLPAIGKPEPLRHEWAGWWSRRITQEHRLVYRVSDNGVEIAVCRFHYGK